MQSRCKNCRCWCFTEIAGGTEQGECRRHAPQTVLDGGGELVTTWPTTEARDWCGEWQPKPGIHPLEQDEHRHSE